MGVTHDSNPGDVPPDAVSSGFYQRATNRQTQPAETTCPRCGYCRHCGRSGHETPQVTSPPAQWPHNWAPMTDSPSSPAPLYGAAQNRPLEGSAISRPYPPGTTFSNF